MRRRREQRGQLDCGVIAADAELVLTFIASS